MGVLRELMLLAEVLLIVAPVVVVVGLLRRAAATRRHALEVERLATMRAAIDRGVLGEADREQVLAAMAVGQQPPPSPAQSWPVAVGWVAGFVGIGLLLIGDQDLRATGIVVGLLGLGLVTLPMAQRELARRDRRPA